MDTTVETMHIEELRSQAEKYGQQGRWSQALSLYERIFQQDPSDWQNCIAMGDAYLNIRRWDAAATAYRASLKIEDSFDWAWHNLGVALFNAGDFAGVARCCQSLQGVNPLFWEVNQSSPIVRKYHRVFTETLAEANTTHEVGAGSTATAPESPEAPSQPLPPQSLDTAEVPPDEVPAAAEAPAVESPIAEQPIPETSAEVEPMIELDAAEQFEALYENAKALSQKGDHEGAVEAYRQAVPFNETHPEIHHFIGDSLLNLNRLDEAIAAYKTSLRYNPDDTWSYFNLGVSLIRNENPKQAVKYFRELLERDPNFSQARLLLANALEAQEKWPEAVEAYSFYLEKIDPENTAVVEKLNELLPKSAESTIGKLTEHLKRAYEAQSENASELDKLSASKDHLEKLNSIALDTFLMTNSTMEFPPVESAKITIILILYNRAELTFSCLNSVLRSNFKSLELVIVDNKSTDRTRQLLKRVKGAKIVLNEENKHFLLACNQANKLATGENLLFLNNDAQVLGNSLENALKTLESSPDIGAVGGKVILPDGSLQEAGSIIWKDGSCLGYGRGDEPDAPQYMFEREVDYCSGAFLLTPRHLFSSMGGFDEALKPAYYEETDFCVRLAEQGKKLIYDPNVVILHYEFGSSSSSEKSGQAIELQKRNKNIFLEKHQAWLSHKQPPALENILEARALLDGKRKVLFVEDRIPHRYYGSGYTRGNTILHSLLDQNCFVTIYPTDLSYIEDWATAHSDIPRNVELMSGYGRPRLKEFLLERAGYYDLVLVSRPHNMEFLSEVMAESDVLKGTKIIYDAEAIFCEREFLQMKLRGEDPSEAFIRESLEKELSLCRNAQHILSVSQKEANRFRELGYDSVGVLGHVLEVKPTPKTFSERKDILFVGAIYDIESPNADSVLWFAEEIFPKIQAVLGGDVNFVVAGTNRVPELNRRVEQLGNSNIKMLGRVDDLTRLYNNSRVFVVPTRFAAGIPHKAHEAAARGIPMVVTDLISQQLNWTSGEQLLASAGNADAADFANWCVSLYRDNALWDAIRAGSIDKVQHDCNSASFNESIRDAIS